jgi:putative ABC transport system permease protein
MKTLLKISWRNVWRNKARSIVIILAVGFGLWGGIVATALITGLLEQQFNSSIKNQVSHIQIHHPDFIKENLTEYNISQTAEIFHELDNSNNVFSYTGRTRTNGMIANASMSSGVEVFGIDPNKEHSTTFIGEQIIDGDYFKSDMQHPIVIGASLADKMKIEVGNRIVLTFQDMQGEITSAAFRVSGIYRTSNTYNDERNIYVLGIDLGKLIGQQGIINEIAILLHNIDDVNSYKAHLQEKFSTLKIRTWSEISPDLSFIGEFSGIAMMVLLIIILFALAFGLLNTMLMTIFERTRELGVLMSVGMSKARIFAMILFETSFLVITGAVFGTIIGAITVMLTGKHGIDLTHMGADTMSEWGFDAIIYPSLDTMFYFNLALLVLITAVLAAVYPAFKALRLRPAEAVRKD